MKYKTLQKTSMLQYLDFMGKVHKINEKFELNHHEIRLLELVANAQHFDQRLYVDDLISHKHIASQATLHGVVKGLIKKNLFTAKTCSSDGRNKTVSLTALSLRRLEELQRLLSQAMAS